MSAPDDTNPFRWWMNEAKRHRDRAEKAEAELAMALADRKMFAEANAHQANMINSIRGDFTAFRGKMAKLLAKVRAGRADARLKAAERLVTMKTYNLSTIHAALAEPDADAERILARLNLLRRTVDGLQASYDACNARKNEAVADRDVFFKALVDIVAVQNNGVSSDVLSRIALNAIKKVADVPPTHSGSQGSRRPPL